MRERTRVRATRAAGDNPIAAMVDFIRGLKGLPEWMRLQEYAHDHKVELRRVSAWSMLPLDTCESIWASSAVRHLKVVPNRVAASGRQEMRGGGRRLVNFVPAGKVNVAFTGE